MQSTAVGRPAALQQGGPIAEPSGRAWAVLGITSLGVYMVFLDSSIANIAFPAISATFHGTSRADLSWVLNAYSIVFAALLLASGRVADLMGRRRIFFAGLLVFVLASLGCGLAPTLPALIAARAVQAVGGAMLLPASLALLLPEFPIGRRSFAVGIWGAVGAVAVASGPSLGAVIVQYAGWRWAFLLNAPVGLAAWLLGRRRLVEARDGQVSGLPDAIGVVLLTAGVGAVALGVVEGPEWGWGDLRVAGSLVVAAVLIPAVVLRSRHHPRAVLDLALFRVRSFTIANLATLVFAAGFAALILGNVLFLTSVWHYEIIRAGLAVTPGPLLAAATAPFSGRLADRIGHRGPLVAGSLIFSAGALLFRLDVGDTPAYAADWLLPMTLTGIGVGLTFPTLGSAAAAALPAARFGAGSAAQSTARQLGFVLGVSALVALIGTPVAAAALAAAGRGWTFAACSGLASALLCAFVGSTLAHRDAAVLRESGG